MRCVVMEAVAHLSERDAEVLLLATWEHLPAVDIAAVLGIAPNAVTQRLHRARQRFAEEYRRLESRPISAPAMNGGAQ